MRRVTSLRSAREDREKPRVNYGPSMSRTHQGGRLGKGLAIPPTTPHHQPPRARSCALVHRLRIRASARFRPVRLSVYAAASLVEVFGEIGQAFQETNPGVQVLFNFAGSQQLAQQIVLGANADVFASANPEQMEVLVDQGQAARQDVHVFATNHLVVVFPAPNPGLLMDLEDLARPGLKLVIAAPQVPAGAYALSFLEMAGESTEFGHEFRIAVLANVVSQEENVRAALSKVELGEADAGIVYASDAARASNVGTLDIPPEMNPTVTYPIAVLRQSSNASMAHAFVDFVRSPYAASILMRYGFTPVER